MSSVAPWLLSVAESNRSPNHRQGHPWEWKEINHSYGVFGSVFLTTVFSV